MMAIDIGSFSASGNRYCGLNQDHVVVQEMYHADELSGQRNKQCYVAAVLDGHGLLGEKAAQQAGKALVRDLCSSAVRGRALSSVLAGDWDGVMQEAFLKGHQAALAIYENPPKTVMYPKGGQQVSYTLQLANGASCYRSVTGTCERMLECGCTCTVAVIQGDCVCIANVGDSTAVLGSDRPCNSSYSAAVLTTLHHGLNAAEAQRIAAANGPSGAHILPHDGYLSVRAGPWAGYELSVTRALGHKHLAQFGVTCVPDVRMLTLTQEDCCLVLASDGVWDHFSPHAAVEHVMDSLAAGRGARGAAHALVEDAVRFAAEDGDGDVDNTSAIVIALG